MHWLEEGNDGIGKLKNYCDTVVLIYSFKEFVSYLSWKHFSIIYSVLAPLFTVWSLLTPIEKVPQYCTDSSEIFFEGYLASYPTALKFGGSHNVMSKQGSLCKQAKCWKSCISTFAHNSPLSEVHNPFPKYFHCELHSFWYQSLPYMKKISLELNTVEFSKDV